MAKTKKSQKESQKSSGIPVWLIACLVTVVLFIIIAAIIFGIIYAIYFSQQNQTNNAANNQTFNARTNNALQINEAAEKQAAEAAVKSFAQAIINLDMAAMQTYCTDNFKQSQFIQTLIAGTEINWDSIQIISSYKNTQGQYEIRAAVTTVASEMSGPSQTLMQNYLVIKQNGQWLVDSLS